MQRIPSDLNLLVALEALLQERTVTRAAARLHMSQPAMSNVLARMRRAYGDPLFIRVGACMEPTPFALALAEPVAQALDILREGVERVTGFDPARSKRKFTLLMPDMGVAIVLPRLLLHLSQVAPDVALDVPQVQLADHAAQLQDGRADLAMQGQTHAFQQRFYRRRLWRHDWMCIARQDHPLLRDGMDLDAYTACKHVRVHSGAVEMAAIDDTLKKLGRERRVALEISSWLGLEALVSQTDCVGTVSRTLATHWQAVAGLQVHPLPFDVPPTSVYLFWHERFHHDPGNTWLRGVIADLFSRPEAA
ncbi:LysR family transcriptional regulator [Piscinibacter sp.]|uniref:LysR family transcriptional regulator n=1 Tax=Piscinibacter sp. TaxID=1903157 RepID=UPI0039E5A039